MKKPKIKKRGGAWLVYTSRANLFKCFNFKDVQLYYNVLLKELAKNEKINIL
jgi:hypothetical protein